MKNSPAFVSALRLLLLAVVCACGLATARAGDSPTTAATTAATQSTQPAAATRPAPKPHNPPPPKTPFQLTEAATEAETASLTMRNIEAEIAGDGSIAVLEGELPILQSEIEARLDETEKLLAASPALQVLGAQERDWSSIQQTLDDWQHTLKRRQSQLDDHKTALDDLQKRWDGEWPIVDYYHRYGSKQGQAILATAEKTLRDTQAQIEKTIADLRTAQIQIAQDEQSVNILAAKVADVLDGVRRAQNDAFNRLFTRNSPPLWNVPLRANEGGGVVSQGLVSFAKQLTAVYSYIQRRHENVSLQITLLVVLSLGLFRVRRVVGQWSDQDQAIKHVSLVFASPVATALVLSLLLSVWIYPQAPRMFWAMIGAAALIPTVVILRRLIDPRLFPILNALVVFYFLDQLRSIVAVVPVMARFLLMLEMMGGAILLILFIRSTKREETGNSLWDVIRFIGWIWTVVFIIAFIGDVIGYDSLANLMGDAALGSAYLAVVLYAAARVVASLILIAMRSRPFVLLGMVRRHQPLLLARLRLGLYWLVSISWVVGVLALLSMLSAAWDVLGKILAAQLSYGDFHLSLGHVLTLVLIIWLSFRISRFIQFVLEEDVYDRMALPSGLGYAISKMVNYVVLLVGFCIGISALGYDMTKFTILVSAFGVGLGFGMQNIVNNFVSGLILLFERPVRVGDVIQMGDTTGVVSHIGIRASIIRTGDSAEIIVPNGNLISNTVTNWTLSNRQRGLCIPISLASTAEPAMMIDLLQRVAAAQPMVTKTPPPQAFLVKLGGDAFNYELHVWTNNAERFVQLHSELAVALNTELMKQKIAIK